MEETKRCPKCGEIKPLSDYHNNNKSKDKHEYNCKKCKIENKELWKMKNREKYLKQGLRHRLRAKYGEDNITDEMVNERYEAMQNRKNEITQAVKEVKNDNYAGSDKEREKIRRKSRNGSESSKRARQKYRRKIRKKQIDELLDPYLKKSIRKQYDIKEIPEGLIELKRAEISAKRELRKHKSILD